MPNQVWTSLEAEERVKRHYLEWVLRDEPDDAVHFVLRCAKCSSYFYEMAYSGMSGPGAVRGLDHVVGDLMKRKAQVEQETRDHECGALTFEEMEAIADGKTA